MEYYLQWKSSIINKGEVTPSIEFTKKGKILIYIITTTDNTISSSKISSDEGFAYIHGNMSLL